MGFRSGFGLVNQLRTCMAGIPVLVFYDAQHFPADPLPELLGALTINGDPLDPVHGFCYFVRLHLLSLLIGSFTPGRRQFSHISPTFAATIRALAIVGKYNVGVVGSPAVVAQNACIGELKPAETVGTPCPVPGLLHSILFDEKIPLSSSTFDRVAVFHF